MPHSTNLKNKVQFFDLVGLQSSSPLPPMGVCLLQSTHNILN